MSGPRRLIIVGLCHARLSGRHRCWSCCFAGGSSGRLVPVARTDIAGQFRRALRSGGRCIDYFWHLTYCRSPSHDRSALSRRRRCSRRTRFIDEIKQAVCDHGARQGADRQPGALRHVFRNAMLIIIAGFPGAFLGAFFGGSLLIETIFSLDGLGLSRFRPRSCNRDYPVVFATLYIFSLIGPRSSGSSPTSSICGSIRASISKAAS
jgi:microcin C transport system permease protein